MPNVMQDAQKGRSARPQRVKGTVALPTGDCPCLTSGTGTGNAGACPLEVLNDARTKLGEGRVLARRGWVGEEGDFFSILLMANHQDM
jgi:hypothetical protein